MAFTFVPPDGYRNVTDFPTKPASETAFRDSMQDLLDQLKDYLNSIEPWGNLTTSSRSSMRAYQSTSQTLSANVSAKVLYQTEIYDNLGEFDTGLSRFTPSHGGHYLVVSSVSIPNVTVSTRFLINVGVNGTENVRVVDTIIPANNSNSIAIGSCVLALSPTDFVEIQVFSSTTFIIENAPTKTVLEIIRIA